MRWYISYPILAAGLAFGFDTLFPGSPDFSSTKAQAQRSAEPDTARNVILASELDTSRITAFSPGVQLAAVVQQPAASGSVLDYLAQTLMPRENAPATPASEALPPITVAAWNGTVTRTVSAPKPVPAVRPDRTSRLALARDIQRELQRVGCYLGEIDGVWGGGSKRAILMFMDRVNATLPTREPDVFMLSLLRTQTDAVCGTTCPSGQSLTANGRCMPSTLMAHAEKAGAPASTDASWEPVVAESAPGRRPEPYGRMSIGGPKPDDVAQLSAGWPRVSEQPRTADLALSRTAALDAPTANDDGTLPIYETMPQAAASSFDTDVAPAPPTVKRAKSGSRSKGSARAYRTSSSRHVQRLFTHPLGSM
jgi:hypothetical protein